MLNKFLILFFIFIGYGFGGEDLKPGDKAPEFNLSDEAGNIHSLSDYSGKIVVLYFYPSDNTPGCTAEACNLRDNYSELLEAGIVILGVNYDSPESHREFIDEHKLPFPLLADTTKNVADSYDAKSFFFGWMVPDRITYLIDEEGYILAIIEDVDTGNHANQILAILKKLRKED